MSHPDSAQRTTVALVSPQRNRCRLSRIGHRSVRPRPRRAVHPKPRHSYFEPLEPRLVLSAEIDVLPVSILNSTAARSRTASEY
jgi:hypothetical protein